ncbi:MAG: c-type cytochrome [Geminicoccaceae bacterium]
MKAAWLKAVLIGLTLTVAIGGTASWVSAHSGAKGVMKERMDMMKGMADAMKAMGAMFKGEAPFEPAIVMEKATFLVDHATKIPEMTPEGSNDHPSEALPIVWQEWDGYVTSAAELADEGKKLVKITSNGADLDAARAQYVKVGKTCGTCHDRFRKPKE